MSNGIECVVCSAEHTSCKFGVSDGEKSYYICLECIHDVATGVKDIENERLKQRVVELSNRKFVKRITDGLSDLGIYRG